MKNSRPVNQPMRIKEIDRNRLVFAIEIKHLVLAGELILKR
jgi:hypothetical protein